MSDSNLNESSSENHQISGNFAILSNIFTSPSLAMTQVQQRYNFVFPLFTMALMTGLVLYTYYSFVDYSWYIDHIVEATAGDLSKAEQNQTRSVMEMMSQSTTGIISAVSMIFLLPIIYVIQSVYFLIVSNINNDGFEFKQWLAFISWTATPGLIAIIAIFVVLFTSSNGQIAPDSMNPLSLNELIFGLESSKGLGKLLSTLHLAQFWSFVVMVIGYKTWTEKSTQSSIIIVLAPYVLFYVGWFLFI